MDKAKSLGATWGSLKDLAGPKSALGNLGTPPKTVAQFVPTVTNCLGEIGGEDTQTLLPKAFGS